MDSNAKKEGVTTITTHVVSTAEARQVCAWAKKKVQSVPELLPEKFYIVNISRFPNGQLAIEFHPKAFTDKNAAERRCLHGVAVLGLGVYGGRHSPSIAMEF